MLNFFQRKKIIIGIHGLSNKPPKNALKSWWKMAILEGLRNLGLKKLFLNFELAYWANCVYPKPLDKKIKDKKDPLFIESPYAKGAKNWKNRKKNPKKQKLLDILEKSMDFISFKKDQTFPIDSLSEYMVKVLYKDLHQYYYGDELDKKKDKKEEIQRSLRELLLKYRECEILLIAHSMGSIIAFDLLHEMENEVNIHTLITIGSPLGLPFILKHILEDQKIDYKKQEKPFSPENILHKWINLSDLNDKVAVNYNLSDDFKANSQNIAPKDFEVFNDYEFQGQKNYHKSIGYLRTPELAKEVYEFLYRDRQDFWQSFTSVIKKLFSNPFMKKNNQ